MFRFSAIEEEHLLGFLKNGSIDDLMDDLILQFRELTPKIQYELIKHIKEGKAYPSLNVLAKVFGISVDEARRMLRGEWREFMFPVVGEEIKMVRGISIRGMENIITNLKHLNTSMEVLREFLREGFALFFDTCFSGESYMLPAVVSLYIDNPPEDAVFTGRIDAKGNIYEVDGIPAKRKLAKDSGLRLIEPAFIDNVKTLKDWYDASAYEIPFYITKTTMDYEGEVKNFYSCMILKDAERILELAEALSGISEKDLLMITGRLASATDDWEQKVSDFYGRLKKIEKALMGREILHIGINGPASLAFALGAVFGSQKPFVIYHFQDGRYYPIEVRNVRSLKERVREYSSVEYSMEGKGRELAVVLALAHHDPVASVKEFMKGRDVTLLVIKHKVSGNIPVEDMFEVAKESSSLIQDMRGERDYERFHFFLSSPVPVAFMLGVAFGYYGSGYVYQHYGQQGYAEAVSLDAIRRIREQGR